ncbi:DMT family transporter [bacterium]|nr:DMT family transporter [bacterium]
MNGRLLIFGAATLWSLSGPLAKLAQLPGPSLACYRALCAGIFLLCFVRGGRLRWRPALLGMVLSFTLLNLTFLWAVTLTSAANAIFLQCTAPLWTLVACLAWLGEKLDRRSLFSVLLGLSGMALIAGGGWGESPLGIALALSSGVFYSLITVFLRYLRDEDPYLLTCINHLSAGLLLLPLTFLPGQVSPAELPWTAALFLAFFGVVQLGTPYLLYAKGLQSVSPQEAGVITLLEPVLSTFLTWLAVGEQPAATTLWGGSIVLIAVALRYLPVLGRVRPNAENVSPEIP